eukprot:scaffold23786_cov129-Isochrysis_galbana.AAC.6
MRHGCPLFVTLCSIRDKIPTVAHAKAAPASGSSHLRAVRAAQRRRLYACPGANSTGTPLPRTASGAPFRDSPKCRHFPAALIPTPCEARAGAAPGRADGQARPPCRADA